MPKTMVDTLVFSWLSLVVHTHADVIEVGDGCREVNQKPAYLGLETTLWSVIRTDSTSKRILPELSYM